MNERSSNDAGCSLINGNTNTSYGTNIEKARLRNRRDIGRMIHFLSKMTPRLRAESTGESMTLLSRLYGDLWHPVFYLKVLSLSSIYDVCYAENE